jgi:uncharacterized protein DUF6580
MLAYLFVLFAIAIRFIPHPWSFTPVAAALLFFGARGSRRQLWVPFLALAISDFVLTKYVYAVAMSWDQLLIFAWYAAILWLGTLLTARQKPLRIIGAALASSVSFFLITNFGVWAATNLYPKTLAGLMDSYAMGVPFFRRSVEGDLLFTIALFATPVALHAMSAVFAKDRDPAAAA